MECKCKRLKKIWQYMVVKGVILTMCWLQLLIGNVSSRNENHSLIFTSRWQKRVSYCCSRSASENCRKNQLKCRSIYHQSNYFSDVVALFVLFFTNWDQTENFLQSLGAMRGSTGPSESLRSLVEFRPWFHICHTCDFIFATFVILYLPPPPSSSPVDIFLRTSICHLTCVKVAPENICHLRCVKSAPDNQTAGGAKPSLFCNMPRFWDTLYFSVKKVFISASLKGRAALSAPLWSLSSQFMSSPSKLGRALAEICFSWICRKHFCCYVPEVFYTKVYSYRKFLLICQYENKHSLWHLLVSFCSLGHCGYRSHQKQLLCMCREGGGSFLWL